MKKHLTFFLTGIMAASISFCEMNAQEVITSWNFENGTQLPNTGNGSLFLIGGTMIEWGKTGVIPGISLPEGFEETLEVRSGSAFQTYNYPIQGTNAKTAGIRLNISTLGFKNILFSADVRQGGTSANKLMLQYTIDGVNWEKAITYTTDDDDTWYLRNFNFSNLPEVNNNALFAVRFVTNYDDDVVGSDVYLPVSGSKIYDRSGPIRFDNIIVRGDKLSKPEDDRTTFSFWGFESKQLLPTEGSGNLQLIGGILYDNLWSKAGIFTNQTIFDQGVYDYASLKNGLGLQTYNYPAQGNNKTAGLRLDINTHNYKDILLTADIRHGGTSANKVVLQYTVNGNDWTDAIVYTSNSGNTWYKRSFDFSTITAASNNSLFGIRYVTAMDGLSYAATGFEKIYAATGPIRFDNIRLSGRIITGVNQLASQDQLKVYIQDRILQFSSSPDNVVIFNLSGSQILVAERPSAIDLSLLPNGVYIVVSDSVRTKIMLH